MKWLTDILSTLISKITPMQSFVTVLVIISLIAGYFLYQEYNKTEVELHKIHSHIDTTYLPAVVPEEHHRIPSGKRSNLKQSKSRRGMASNG